MVRLHRHFFVKVTSNHSPHCFKRIINILRDNILKFDPHLNGPTQQLFDLFEPLLLRKSVLLRGNEVPRFVID